MRMWLFVPALVALLVMMTLVAPTSASDPMRVIETCLPTLEELHRHSESLNPQRREVLQGAIEHVVDRLAKGEEARLTFICTHNSRRSHLAQVWAKIAADYYALDQVSTFSGGTEATACNLRTVQALRRAGLQVVATTDGANPKYLLQYADNRQPLLLYSKRYDAQENPHAEFAAMLCCSEADEECPVVTGAALRVALHYVDPKVSDDSPEEGATYDHRSKKIGGEMFYLFRSARDQLRGAKPAP